MRGWLEISAGEFASLNAQWTALKGGCDNYTFSRPSSNPLKLWVRIEDDFIEGDIKTYGEAVALGMGE